MAYEIIKDIPSFPKYKISSNGHVISYRQDKPLTMRISLCRDGYARTSLQTNGKSSAHYIHKLMLAAFHGEKPDGYEARHLDGDKLNNHPSNLAWGTHSENECDKMKHGTQRKYKIGSYRAINAAVLHSIGVPIDVIASKHKIKPETVRGHISKYGSQFSLT